MNKTVYLKLLFLIVAVTGSVIVANWHYRQYLNSTPIAVIGSITSPSLNSPNEIELFTNHIARLKSNGINTLVVSNLIVSQPNIEKTYPIINDLLIRYGFSFLIIPGINESSPANIELFNRVFGYRYTRLDIKVLQPKLIDQVILPKTIHLYSINSSIDENLNTFDENKSQIMTNQINWIKSETEYKLKSMSLFFSYQPLTNISWTNQSWLKQLICINPGQMWLSSQTNENILEKHSCPLNSIGDPITYYTETSIGNQKSNSMNVSIIKLMASGQINIQKLSL